MKVSIHSFVVLGFLVPLASCGTNGQPEQPVLSDGRPLANVVGDARSGMIVNPRLNLVFEDAVAGREQKKSKEDR